MRLEWRSAAAGCRLASIYEPHPHPTILVPPLAAFLASTAFAAVVWLLVAAAPLAALPVPEALARIVAHNTIRQHIAVFGSWGGVQHPQIEAVEPIAFGTDRLAYNVRVRPTGHVLVAPDDEFSPVLLYSDTHSFDVSKVEDPDAFESWLVAETGNVLRTVGGTCEREGARLAA